MTGGPALSEARLPVCGGRWGIECAAANVGDAAAIVDLPGLLFTAGGGESSAQPSMSEGLLRLSIFPLACCLRRAVGNRSAAPPAMQCQRRCCLFGAGDGKSKAVFAAVGVLEIFGFDLLRF